MDNQVVTTKMSNLSRWNKRDIQKREKFWFQYGFKTIVLVTFNGPKVKKVKS